MSIAVKINSQNQQKVRTMAPISSSVANLADLADVSIIDNSNNSVVVYNENTLKYEVKALPVVYGGTF